MEQIRPGCIGLAAVLSRVRFQMNLKEGIAVCEDVHAHIDKQYRPDASPNAAGTAQSAASEPEALI